MVSDVQIDDKEFDIPQVDTPPTLESILNEVRGARCDAADELLSLGLEMAPPRSPGLPFSSGK